MYKALVWDMDGTMADLYGVSGWLDMLHNEDSTPYSIAKPLVDMDSLIAILESFKKLGWTIVVNSWCAKGSSKEYDSKVRKAKLDWLAEVGFPYDEIHITKYGTTKANATRKKGGYQVLIDDNDSIRSGWNLGRTIDPRVNLLSDLVGLLLEEIAMEI